MGIIYYCQNIVNGKGYIGQTKNTLDQRRSGHYSAIKDGTYFHNAILKYGKDNFIWSIIEICPDELLSERETYWIKQKDTYFKNGKGYNMTMNEEGAITTSQKPVRCKNLQTKEFLDFSSMTRAANELNNLYPNLHFTQEYISKICHGEAYSYHSLFTFCFLDKDNEEIATGYIKKETGWREAILAKSNKVRITDNDGNIYTFPSLTQAQKELGINRHTLSRAIKRNGIIISGKFKGWRGELL